MGKAVYLVKGKVGSGGLLEEKFSSLSIQQDKCGLTSRHGFSKVRAITQWSRRSWEAWVNLGSKEYLWGVRRPAYLQRSTFLCLLGRWRNPTHCPHRQTHQSYLSMRKSSKQHSTPSCVIPKKTNEFNDMTRKTEEEQRTQFLPGKLSFRCNCN